MVLSRLSVYTMLPNVVIMDCTGLNLKYFSYFVTDKDTRLNLVSQNSSCRGRFNANEALHPPGTNIPFFGCRSLPYVTTDSQSADLRLLIRSATFSKYLWTYEGGPNYAVDQEPKQYINKLIIDTENAIRCLEPKIQKIPYTYKVHKN